MDTHGEQNFSEEPNALQFLLFYKQFLFPGAGPVDIDGGKRPFISQFPVEHDFHIASAFEFFKNYVIHTASGIHQGGSDDGQTAAFLQIPRGAKKPFGPL